MNRLLSLLCSLAVCTAGCGRASKLPGDNGNLECRNDSDCPIGLCTNHACLTKCREDVDCGGTYFCQKLNVTDEFGYCRSAEGNPVLSGNPRALRMTDNLDNAFQFVSGRHDEVYLSRIIGIGLDENGTIDLGDQNASWSYYFQDGTGETGPATLIYVIYWQLAGESQGDYYGNVGDSPLQIIPEQSWRAFKDASELVMSFQAEPGCDSLQRGTGDAIYYQQSDNGPEFILTNWNHQSYVGNPVNGEASAICPE